MKKIKPGSKSKNKSKYKVQDDVFRSNVTVDGKKLFEIH